jgi:hypothetical protein
MNDWYQLVVWGIVITGAVCLDLRLVQYLKTNKERLVPVVVFGRHFYLISAVRTLIQELPWFSRRFSFQVVAEGVRSFDPITSLTTKPIVSPRSRSYILNNILPVVLIVGWALWVGRGYLDFNPLAYPNGGDFPLQVYSHFGWYSLRECGTCVFWNGVINGGQPTFAEVQGASLHPLIILTTLLWGAINGAKVVLVTSLITLGLSQWWLSRVIGLGPLAGLWGALFAVVGGHIADRMAGGLMNVVFSLASATLILPPLVDLIHNNNRRAAVLVGIFLGLTFLSGQGYIQIAIILGLFPALGLYLFSHNGNARDIRAALFFAVSLAVLLSAVLWLPVLQLLVATTKYGDPHIAYAQSFDIIPLNLVLRQEKSLFIGWIPILLALSTLHLVPNEKKKLVWFFFLSIGLIFLVSSSTFLQFMHKYFDQIGMLRFTDNMTILAVPFLLALSAWGLDRLLQSPVCVSLKTRSETINIHFAWLLFPALLLLALPPVYEFSRWRFETHVVIRPEPVMQWLETEYTELVHLPTPDFEWMPLAIERGLKLTGVWRPWFWKDRGQPSAHLEVNRDPVENPEQVIDNLYLLRHEQNRYAAVYTPDGGFFPCQAKATGGHIDVSCTNDRPGKLVVMENYFSGWNAWVDGKPVPFFKDTWLKVDAPAGHHTYTFRYRPWEVWVGLALSLIGIVIAGLAWRKNRV